MKISLNSVIVQDQEHALNFYTEVLGFEKKVDIPAGDHRWLTVVSKEDPEGAQLALEPNAHPAAATYQKALHESKTPLTSFEVGDVQAEFDRLSELGVIFTTEPTDIGGAVIAAFDDTCGNLIQIYRES